ncbi:MAG: ribonuclease P protein subunit [Thaumarchaeota archaeon]|nr:ribonuclease P protein subunit [Nitrososphaerota archaeon]MDE1866483.1 ribonuclease P protein subunit [Nitrososphaerota archaeon]
MITKENIASHELIGLEAQIVESTNKQIIGLAGKVVDETKSMFTLRTQKGNKKFPKAESHWNFSFNNDQVKIDGARLTKRPYERMGVKA